MAKEQEFPAPMGKCPVCKKPMSIEMLPVGLTKKDEKGKQKILPAFEAALFQTIRWSAEMAIRSIIAGCTAGMGSQVASERHLYYTCNNQECPACYKASNPTYFKKNVLGGFELVKMFTPDAFKEMEISRMKSTYEKQQNKKK